MNGKITPSTSSSTPEPLASSSHHHKIGIPAAVAYFVGNVVGSGIFFTPAIVVRYTGSVGLSLVVWVLAAIIALMGSLCFIELGTCIPKSGGHFVYLRHAEWSSLASIAVLLNCALINPCITAVQALTLGEYVLEGVGQWACIEEGWRLMFKRLAGFSVIFILLFINMFSLKRFAARFQLVATGVKISVIAAIILIGIYFLAFRGGGLAFAQPFTSASPVKISSLYAAIIPALFAYTGWSALTAGTEEIREPSRTLPIATLVGLAIVAAIFLLVNIAFFAVLSVPEMSKSAAVAFTFASKAIEGSQHFIPFFVGMLLISNQNCMLFITSRLVLAGARAGILPTLFTCVNKESMSPRPALFFDVSFAFMLSFIGDLDELIGYLSCVAWIFDALIAFALIYMRWRRFPFAKDAYRNPIAVPVAFAILATCIALIPAINRPMTGVASCAALALAFGLYYSLIRRERTPAVVARLSEWSLHMTQVVLNVTPMLEGDEIFEGEELDRHPSIKSRSQGSIS